MEALLEGEDVVASMDATRTLLALALVPDRLCLYAAVSYTKLLDQPIAAARDAAIPLCPWVTDPLGYLAC